MTPLTRAAAQQRAAEAEAAAPAGPACDPAEHLGPDCLGHILSFLPPDGLLAAAGVCRAWREAAGQDQLWGPLCEAAWAPRAYVPAARRADLAAKRRWLAAEADLGRVAITERELTTFLWRFRFKHQAGAFWCALDPWHASGGRLWLHRAFLPDGRTAPAGHAALWEPLWDAVGVHDFRWRICKSQQGRPGCFVKIHTFPSMVPSRTPDGGWRLENEWVIYEACLQPGGPYSRGIPPGAEPYLQLPDRSTVAQHPAAEDTGS